MHLPQHVLVTLLSLLYSIAALEAAKAHYVSNLFERGFGFYDYYYLSVESSSSNSRAEIAEMLFYGVAGKRIHDLHADVVTLNGEDVAAVDPQGDCTGGGKSTVQAAVDGVVLDSDSDTVRNSFVVSRNCSNKANCLACWFLKDDQKRDRMLRVSSTSGKFAAMAYRFTIANAVGCPIKWKVFGAQADQPRSQWTLVDEEDMGNVNTDLEHCWVYPLRKDYRPERNLCMRDRIRKRYKIIAQPLRQLVGTGGHPCQTWKPTLLQFLHKGTGGVRAPKDLFDWLDKKRNDKLDPEEFRQPVHKDLIRKSDSNPNGTAGLAAPNDKNGDGKLQLAQPVHEAPKDLFDSLDKKRNGKLQPEEIPQPAEMTVMEDRIQQKTNKLEMPMKQLADIKGSSTDESVHLDLE